MCRVCRNGSNDLPPLSPKSCHVNDNLSRTQTILLVPTTIQRPILSRSKLQQHHFHEPIPPKFPNTHTSLTLILGGDIGASRCGLGLQHRRHCSVNPVTPPFPFTGNLETHCPTPHCPIHFSLTVPGVKRKAFRPVVVSHQLTNRRAPRRPTAVSWPETELRQNTTQCPQSSITRGCFGQDSQKRSPRQPANFRKTRADH